MASRTSRRTLTTLLLVYLLVLSLFSPLALSARSARSSKAVKPPAQGDPNAPRREGELLVRFHPGLSKTDKDTILATQGARKKKDLEGGSRIEQLEVVNYETPGKGTLVRKSGEADNSGDK